MEREKFVKLVEEALDALPIRFRKRMQNVSVLVENIPPEQRSQRGSRNSGIADVGDLDNLVLGVFEGVPATQKSVFEVPTGTDRIVLYQKNIEAVCSNEDEIRRGNSSDSNPRTRSLFRDDRSSTRRDLIPNLGSKLRSNLPALGRPILGLNGAESTVRVKFNSRMVSPFPHCHQTSIHGSKFTASTDARSHRIDFVTDG
jgi:predicted Zn-dependent protease with MMP-like domain